MNLNKKKMKKIRFKNIVISSFIALLLTACMPDNVTVYDGPLLAEFSNLSGNPTVNYAWSSTGRFWNTEIRGANRPDTALQVQLIGTHQSTPLKVGYYVAPQVFRDISKNRLTPDQPEGVEGTDWVRLTTTAVEGVDYTILDGGVVTFAPNSSFTKMRFSTTPTADRMMYIVLQEMDIKPSINARVFRLRIRP
jgi:hypothetical protein